MTTALQRFALGSCLCALLTAGARAQIVLYQTDFSGTAGWNLEGCWAVDGFPSLPSGAAHSGTTSLNCNDASGGYTTCHSDHATSPVIDLSVAPGGAQATFWCRWSTEEKVGCVVDAKALHVTDASGQNVLKDVCINSGACGLDFFQWHQHTVSLNPAWGQVRLRFRFDVFDDILNFGVGWFVDDLVVSDACNAPQPYCLGKFNSAGCIPWISTMGQPSWSGSGTPLELRANAELNQQTGMLIWSPNAAMTPFAGGFLCLGSPVNRTAGQSSGGNASPPSDCSGSYTFAFTPAFLQANGLQPGTSVFGQFWSRDPGLSAPENVGLTEGVRFTVCN